MLLFITRKYPPSVGGMEKLSYRLTTEIALREEAQIISWGWSQRWLPLFLLSAFVRATWALARDKVALIHLGDPLLAPLGVVLRRLGRVPVVVNAHGLDVIHPHPLYQSVIPWCLRQMDCVICISLHTRSECLKRGIPPGRCVVIPPGIDVKDYPASMPEDIRSRAAQDWKLRRDGRHVLLTVGRLVPRKGIVPFVSQVLPLLRRLRDDWLYLVVGEGPERTSIETAVADHGLTDRVRLLGRLSECELKSAYAMADLFVMPNIPVAGDTEGFGMVSLEARAAGVPVVASDLEGIKESMSDELDGLLVPPGDHNAYVQAIDHLLGRGSRAEARQRRDSIAARYDWSSIVDRYLHVFERVQADYSKERGHGAADSH